MVVRVTEFLGLHGFHLMRMPFGENLLMLDRLDRGVVVILVHLAVDRGLNLFMANGLDVLLDHGGCNALVDTGIMAPAAGEVGDCRSGFVHGRR